MNRPSRLAFIAGGTLVLAGLVPGVALADGTGQVSGTIPLASTSVKSVVIAGPAGGVTFDAGCKTSDGTTTTSLTLPNGSCLADNTVNVQNNGSVAETVAESVTAATPNASPVGGTPWTPVETRTPGADQYAFLLVEGTNASLLTASPLGVYNLDPNKSNNDQYQVIAPQSTANDTSTATTYSLTIKYTVN